MKKKKKIKKFILGMLLGLCLVGCSSKSAINEDNIVKLGDKRIIKSVDDTLFFNGNMELSVKDVAIYDSIDDARVSMDELLSHNKYLDDDGTGISTDYKFVIVKLNVKNIDATTPDKSAPDKCAFIYDFLAVAGTSESMESGYYSSGDVEYYGTPFDINEEGNEYYLIDTGKSKDIELGFFVKWSSSTKIYLYAPFISDSEVYFDLNK